MQGTAHSSWKSVSLALLITIPLFAGLNFPVSAQELADNILPDAPVPMMHQVHAVMRDHPVPQTRAPHRWLNLNNFSVAFLLAGEALDMWSTRINLAHPRWICGNSPAFGNAVTYISNDDTHYDPQTIQNKLCGAGPSGQLANYAYDVTRTGAFTEDGWAANLHLTGSRNFAGVLAWNLADDAGQMLAAHYLSRRKGLIGKLAPGINLSHGFVHVGAGVLNIQFARTHRDPGLWQFHLPDEARLYPNPRWWGRR